MIIDFNEFFRMRVDITKVNDNLFQLTMEKVYIGDDSKGFHTSKNESFFDRNQLSAFVNYINEATRDHI